jgi:hypothetical protein
VSMVEKSFPESELEAYLAAKNEEIRLRQERLDHMQEIERVENHYSGIIAILALVIICLVGIMWP